MSRLFPAFFLHLYFYTLEASEKQTEEDHFSTRFLRRSHKPPNQIWILYLPAENTNLSSMHLSSTADVQELQPFLTFPDIIGTKLEINVQPKFSGSQLHPEKHFPNK
jgi:hypothetical protein